MGTRSSLQESSGGCHFSDGMCVLGPFAILESVVFGRVTDRSVSLSDTPQAQPCPGRKPERPVRPRRTTQFRKTSTGVVAWTERARARVRCVCDDPEGIPESETLLPPPRPTPTFALGIKRSARPRPTFRPSGPRRRAQPQGGQVSGPRSPIRDRDSYCTVGACAHAT